MLIRKGFRRKKVPLQMAIRVAPRLSALKLVDSNPDTSAPVRSAMLDLCLSPERNGELSPTQPQRQPDPGVAPTCDDGRGDLPRRGLSVRGVSEVRGDRPGLATSNLQRRSGHKRRGGGGGGQKSW